MAPSRLVVPESRLKAPAPDFKAAAWMPRLPMFCDSLIIAFAKEEDMRRSTRTVFTALLAILLAAAFAGSLSAQANLPDLNGRVIRAVTENAFTPLNFVDPKTGKAMGWEYDAVLNIYKRLQYFKPHIDDISKQQLSAKNIVVQIVKVTPVPKDPLLQVDIDLSEGGRAIIFQDGQAIRTLWRKEDGRTRFYGLLRTPPLITKSCRLLQFPDSPKNRIPRRRCSVPNTYSWSS